MYDKQDVATEEQKAKYPNYQPILNELNPYVTIPRFGKKIIANDMYDLGKALFTGPIQSESYISLLEFFDISHIQVVPMIAIDFSLANLTFNDDQCLHSTKIEKQNDYRDIVKAISESF